MPDLFLPVIERVQAISPATSAPNERRSCPTATLNGAAASIAPLCPYIMCRVAQNVPWPPSSGAEASDSGTGISQFLTRVLDQLSPSSWLPAIMVVANLALLLQLSAQHSVDIGRAVLALTKAPIGLLVVLILAIVVTSIVTQAFAFSVIRILEGYWGPVKVVTAWSSLRTRRHARRVERLRTRYGDLERDAFSKAKQRMREQSVPWDVPEIMERQRSVQPVDKYNPDLVALAERLDWRLYAPPEELHRMDAIHSLLDEYPRRHRLLPTRLGNTLRSREDELVRDPNEPLEEFVLRRFAAMDPDLWTQHRRFRSQLDIYCLLTLIFAGLAVLSPVLLIPSTSAILGPALFGTVYAGLSVVSYRAAIASARGYTAVLRTIGARTAAAET
jgi:hypothetical protein